MNITGIWVITGTIMIMKDRTIIITVHSVKSGN